MDARIAFALVCALGCASGDPILPLHPHVALPHNLPKDPIGVQQVPVHPLGHYAGVGIRHLGAPLAAPLGYSPLLAHSPLFAHAHAVAPTVAHVAPAAPAPVVKVAASPSIKVTRPASVAVKYAPAAVKARLAPIAIQSLAAKAPVKVVAPVKVAAPLAVPALPAVPSGPVKSQYHAQDELGQYSFGYTNEDSARQEVRDALGVVRGSYSYRDAHGRLQTQHYVSDAAGFRVAGTNLPVA